MKDFVVEHHIQRDIIRRLAMAPTLRFSELKPDGMESNIFMYHLNQLIRHNYVTKRDKAYSLAIQGLRYVDNAQRADFRPAPRPKPLSVLVLENSRGEVLLALRHIQPYINMYMFISGKQHFGEDPSEHAERELQEKAGLSGIPLRRRGLIDFRIRTPDGDVITHITGHVHSGVYDGPLPANLPSRYDFTWVSPAELKTLSLLPGTTELHNILQANPDSPFFASSDFTLS